jgi:hypothetical protein
MPHHIEGNGTEEDPWILTTPPGQSEFDAWRDETAEPPALRIRVGSTTLAYQLRCIEDLHAMLVAHGDWMPLGNADEQKEANGQPGRRLVRAAQGVPGPVRELRAPGPRTSRVGRSRAQRSKQPHAGPVMGDRLYQVTRSIDAPANAIPDLTESFATFADSLKAAAL